VGHTWDVGKTIYERMLKGKRNRTVKEKKEESTSKNGRKEFQGKKRREARGGLWGTGG